MSEYEEYVYTMYELTNAIASKMNIYILDYDKLSTYNEFHFYSSIYYDLQLAEQLVRKAIDLVIINPQSPINTQYTHEDILWNLMGVFDDLKEYHGAGIDNTSLNTINSVIEAFNDATQETE